MATRSRSSKPAAKSKRPAARKQGAATPRGRRSSPRRAKKGGIDWERLARAVFNGAVWGVVLVLLALFTVLALLSPTPGALTQWWLEQLSLLFGLGAYLIPLVSGALGLYLFLHASGQSNAIPAARLLGIVLLWWAFQATAHLVGDATDAPALAGPQPGDYGGWMGWVLSQSLMTILGPGLTLAVLLLLATGGIVLLLGISPDQFFAAASATAGAAVDFLLTLPRRLRRQPGIIRAHPTRGARWREWLRGLWPLRLRAANALDESEGPITTLPPDPSMPGAAAAAGMRPTPAGSAGGRPPAASLRIIGGEHAVWRLPQIDHILEDVGGGEISEEDLAERARTIEETLHAFGVPVTVVEVNKGPAVTQFGLRPEYVTRRIRGEEKRMKVRVSKIQALSNDISLALAAAPIRIEAPVPGRNIVGLEVPNHHIALVSLRAILESEEFQHLKGPLRIGLGQDVSGRAVAASLGRMPHLLVAGATGSGKSVCINAVICSLLFQYTPDQLRFVMIDPKRVELTGYNDIPHLVAPVVTEIDRVVGVLHWATTEMDSRYRELAQAGARNIEVYNAMRTAEGRRMMPYIVIIVDELADIMMMSPDEVERSLVRIAQMARATGIHLVISTQRPSVNVVTGLIKANFPSRIAFAVSSQIDSRVILDTPGAERLLGRGDLLFMRPDSAKLARLQGAFVSDAEVNRLVRYWRGLGAAPQDGMRPLDSLTEQGDEAETDEVGSDFLGSVATQRPLWDDMIAQVEAENQRDALFNDAVAVVQEAGRASTSLLQRRLRIGYTRAARLIDLLEEEGIVGPDQGGSRGREILPADPSDDQN